MVLAFVHTLIYCIIEASAAKAPLAVAETRLLIGKAMKGAKEEMKYKANLLLRREVGWYGITLLILAAVYFGTGRLGLSLGAMSGFATLVWLPSGIAVSALFLWRSSLWPAITLGAFFVNLFTGAPWLVAIGIAIGNTLEAVVCTALLKRAQVCPALDSLHDVLALVLLAAPTSAFISATLGVGSLSLGGVIVWSLAPVTWGTWWLGDMMSLLLLTPFLLTWSTWPQAALSRKRLIELSLCSGLVVVVSLFVFLGLFRPRHWDYQITHFVYPALAWAALRFGPRGATVASVAFAGLAIVGTILGVSPFSTGNLWLRLLFLQSLLGIMAATTLILATRHALEQRKDEFITLASHELRTPLTSLLGYTQLSQRQLAGLDYPHTLRSLARVEAQAKQISRLAADLLDLSKIQAGKLIFSQEAVDVEALVHEVVEQFQQTSTYHHQISIEGSAPGTIVSDRERLSQVLINLLTNAMKYSPHAEQIIVHLTSTAEYLTVSIQDFGIGISTTEQKKVFKRFYRVAGVQRQAAGDLGIGLFIAHQIIELSGGKLWVKSVEGQGSTFSFSLPWRSPQRKGAVDDAAAKIFKLIKIKGVVKRREQENM